MLWMGITVVPYTLAILMVRLFGASSRTRYRIARAWLKLSVDSADIMGIRTVITGMEHLPTQEKQGVVLLVKHQSTYEIPPCRLHHAAPAGLCVQERVAARAVFGWSIGSLDMIHIDRGQGVRLCQGGAAGPGAAGAWHLGHHVPRGHARGARPGGAIQEWRDAAGH